MAKNTEVSKFEICEVDGHPFGSSDMRVVLLCCADDKFLNLEAEYEDAGDDVKKGINVALEKWKMNQSDKKRHHGWNSGQFDGKCSDCYVFKHTSKQVRIYGYLFHPQPQSRVVCCVLMHFTTKNEDATDEKVLNELIRLGNDPELKKQVELFYQKHLQEKEKINEGQKRKT